MKTSRFVILAVSLILLAVLALIVISIGSPVFAETDSTFTVNASNDVVDDLPGDGICETFTGNGMCTLRAAIMEANAHIGADTIILPAATYLLTIQGAGENQGATGDLDITDALTIIGDPSGGSVIDANGLGDRVLEILPAGGPVSISNVTIKNGSTTQHGGGIYATADLELYDVYLIHNHADGSGGGIDTSASLTMVNGNIEQNSADQGGGIYSYTPLIMENILFANNTSVRYGGGLFVSVAVAKLVTTNFYYNDAKISGGAIYTDRVELTIKDSILGYNTSASTAGGIYCSSTGIIFLMNVQFVNNSAVVHGGAIDNDQAVIHGQDVLFDQNSISGYGAGGAIINSAGAIDIDHGVFSNNTGYVGGAIANNGLSAIFKLINSTVISNTAGDKAGGIYNYGTMSIRSVTISNNSATVGGGINNYGVLSLTNSTISGNKSISNGGGIFNYSTAFVNSSTITNNMASSTGISGNGGGVYANPASTFVFRNTILYGNHHRVTLIPYNDDYYGTLSPQHYNLVGTLNNCILNNNQGHDLIGINPLLGSLSDNGGPTQTHALLVGSPAIDAANPNGCYDHLGTYLTKDQRGLPRIWDGNGDGVSRCDIGSFEYGSKILFFPPMALK